MANVRINASAVLSASHNCEVAKQRTQGVRNYVCSVNGALDGQIRQCAGIASRLNGVSWKLDDITNRINAIQRACEANARTYLNTDKRIKSNVNVLNSSSLSKFK